MSLDKKTLHIIDEMRMNSSESTFSIAGKRRDGHVYIWDLCRHIKLDDKFIELVNWVEYVVNIESIDLVKSLHTGATISDYVEMYTGLPKAIENLYKQQKFAEKHSLGELEVDRAIICDHIEEMLLGLYAIRSYLNEKHKRREGTYILPLDFCALCWRRVRHYEDSPEDEYKICRDSSYYCYYHHPKSHDYNYDAAKNALMHSIKNNEGNFFRDEVLMFEKKEHQFDRLPIALNGWFKSLRPKVEVTEEIKKNKGDWCSLAEALIKHSKNAYPKVYEKIKNSNHSEHSSWGDWLQGSIIRTLDEKETQYWKDYYLNGWLDDQNWELVINLFERYQVYESMMASRRKPGRPKDKKEKVKVFIDKYLDDYGALPKTSLIARECQVSRTTIAQVKKEEGYG